MAPNPPLGFPSDIVISGIAPGKAGSGAGGNIVHTSGDMVAKIVGDAASAFSVLSLETLRLERDPDARGSGKTWQTVATVDNAGPISVGANEALMISAGFGAPLFGTQTTFTASIQVVANGTDQPVVLEVPLTGNLDAGSLQIVAVTTPPMFAGSEAVFHFRLNSSLLTEVAGVFTCDPAPGDDSPFRSDTQPQFPTIAPGAQIEFDLPVTCPAGTPAGNYNVLFGLKNIGDKNFRFSQRIPIKVKGTRSVQVIPSLLPDLTLAQGASVRCELRVVVTGGPGVVTIAPGSIPFGITLDNAQQTLSVDGSAFAGIQINVDPQAPLNTTPVPLTINWALAADGLHDAISDVVAFNLRIVPPEPAELHFDRDSIVFDDSTSANGNVHVTFRRDGTFNFHGHFHDSGAVDINYQLMAAVLDTHGTLFTMTHSGRVAGSITPGSPDDNWDNEGRDDRIAQNWLVLLEGGVEFKARASATLDFTSLSTTGLGSALGVLDLITGVIALI